MIERISKNEERLDKVLSSIKKLEESLDEFQSIQKDLSLLNRYYGSKNWFIDKDKYEEGLIPPIKAGVLSEDIVWNMNEEIHDLIDKMKNIIKKYK